MKKIAIIGGLGYVGLHLIDYLKSFDYEITVLGRKNLTVLRDEEKNIFIRDINSMPGTEKFDIVVNLAFPTSYSRKKNFDSNRKIAGIIKSFSGKDSIIIHTSTLAVFGTALDIPIKNNRISMRRDSNYPEVKIHMENLLQDEFKNHRLHILRLGNVWGPGAPAWVKQVADRIVFESPFPDNSKSAPSNITYVKNICDFIHWTANDENTGYGIHFHHFAEYFQITWGTIFENFGYALNEDIIYKPFQIAVSGSWLTELKQLLEPIYPEAIFYKMLELRKMSSIAKNIVDIIPTRTRQNLKSYPTKSIKSNSTMDIVFSNQVAFKHKIDSDWIPKFSYEKALLETLNYLRDVGYLLKESSPIS